MINEKIIDDKKKFVKDLDAFEKWLKTILKWVLKKWDAKNVDFLDLCNDHVTCLYSKFCEIGNKFMIFYLQSSLIISQFHIHNVFSFMLKNIKFSKNELLKWIKKFYDNFLDENFIKYNDYQKNMFDSYLTSATPNNDEWLSKFKLFFKEKRNEFVHSITIINDLFYHITDFIYICPIYLLYIHKIID